MPDLSDITRKLRKIKKNHPLYSTWLKMKERCHNPNYKRYSEWGGRGIKVCFQWKYDFFAFAQYMGPKPSEKHSIDRINNDGNYEPGNVRWATPREQTLNSSHAVMLTYNGKTQCLKDWADELGFSYKCITKRWQSGKTVEEILLPPSKKPIKAPKPRGWMFEGKFWCYKDLAHRYGIPVSSMLSRYAKGWSVERAISQPIRRKGDRDTILPKTTP